MDGWIHRVRKEKLSEKERQTLRMEVFRQEMGMDGLIWKVNSMSNDSN